MNYGAYDRVISIQSKSVADSDYSDNEDSSWSNVLSNVSASLTFPGGRTIDESFEGDQRVANAVVMWTIMYPNNITITNQMRVVYDSKNYYIGKIREIGLRQELELTTELRDND